MKRLLLFPFVLIFNLITENIIKVISYILFGFSLYGMSICDKEMTKVETVVTHIVLDKSHVYLTRDENFKLGLHELDGVGKVVNNKLYYQVTSDAFSLLAIAIFLTGLACIITFIMGTLCDDDDISWEFWDNWQRSLNILIVCELENDKYYYMIFGRLLGVSEEQVLYTKNLASHFSLKGFAGISNLPLFDTKTGKRNKFLDEIGV